MQIEESERGCKGAIKGEGFAFTIIGSDSENAQLEAYRGLDYVANIPDSAMIIF